MLRIEPKQGISWLERGNGLRFGLVLESDDNGVIVVEAFPFNGFVRCHDDKGATRDDEHNVRLKGCPPPFTRISTDSGATGRTDGAGYVVAGISDRLQISSRDFDMLHVRVIDDGAEISDELMDEVLYHPWDDGPQKEISISRDRAKSAADFFGFGSLGSEKDGLELE